MDDIKRVAVLGSGVMGSGIAAHLANCGIPCLMLDMAPRDLPPGEGDNKKRNALGLASKKALLKTKPPQLFLGTALDRIEVGNFDDDLAKVSECDWIIEVVVERLDIKNKVFEWVAEHRRPGSIVATNTSGLPLVDMAAAMPEEMRQHFLVTHFFNPVRYMRLLEIVKGPDTRSEVIETLTEFCDVALGKGVVACNDTPGFLGNRVGVFALQVGLVEAVRAGLTVEEADAIMGRPMGIPKTGVFGLYDRIGLDLMLVVAASLRGALADDDPFQEVAAGIPAVAELVARGHTGNKGGAGFLDQGATSLCTLTHHVMGFDSGGDTVRSAWLLRSRSLK